VPQSSCATTPGPASWALLSASPASAQHTVQHQHSIAQRSMQDVMQEMSMKCDATDDTVLLLAAWWVLADSRSA
jgi:hypothetical protein